MTAHRVLLAEPAAAWRRGGAAWRFAYAVGTVLMVAGLAHGLAWLVAGGAWAGPVSYRKPFSFGLSFGITTITLAWIADRLGVTRRTGRWLLVPLALANTSEVAWVTVQRARGVPSHFNTSTALDAALYTLMGGAAIAVTVTVVIALAAIAFRRPVEDGALQLALRAGLAILVVAMVGGGLMIGVGNERALSGQTTDLVRWGAAGNMKVTHAIAMHAVQLLPGLALVLSATDLGTTLRRRIVAIAAVGHAGLLAAGTIQWITGRGLLDPGWIDGPLWLVSAAALVSAVAAAVAAAVRGPGPPRPVGA